MYSLSAQCIFAALGYDPLSANSAPGRICFTPFVDTFNLAGATLAVTLLFDETSVTNIPASKQISRIRETSTFALAANSEFRFIDGNITFDATSAATARGHVIVGAANVNGAAPGKGVYGAAFGGSNVEATGAVVGVNALCVPGPHSSDAHGAQVSLDSSAGTVRSGLFIAGNGGANANASYGVLIDDTVKIQNAGFHMKTNGNANFLELENTGGTGVLFKVGKNGDTLIAPNTPANAGASGEAGMLAWDATHIYVCVATNTWVRASLATW